jgi:biotin carboxyl carrier protein
VTRNFLLNGECVAVSASRDSAATDSFIVTVGDQICTVKATRMSDGMIRVSYQDGRCFRAALDRDATEPGQWWLTLNGSTHRFQEDEGQGVSPDDASAVEAPMPGKVLEVKVKAGQAVKAGDVLMIVEAMKMEHPLKAPRDATVAEVKSAPGDMVKPGRPLVLFEQDGV